MRGEWQNVFEIWRGRGRALPFRVRRWSWSPTRTVTVTRISDVKESAEGTIYGRAWVRDGWYHGRVTAGGQPGESGLDCAGCYQWEEVPTGADAVRRTEGR